MPYMDREYLLYIKTVVGGGRPSNASKKGSASKAYQMDPKEAADLVSQRTGYHIKPLDSPEIEKYKKLLESVKQEIKTIQAAKGCDVLNDEKEIKEKKGFTIQQEPLNTVHKGAATLYRAQDKSGQQVVAKTYDFGGKDPETYKKEKFARYYCQILRHIAGKSPFIIKTFDLFRTPQRFYIMHEMADKGSVRDYLSKNKVDKLMLHKWSVQTFKAIDKLGEMGISHRSIRPHHILLSGNDMNVKLTGFYNATLYLDLNRNEVIRIPCMKGKPEENFAAPEMYGNGDFDPIEADVWSLGATILWFIIQEYPFDVNKGPSAQDINAKVDKINIPEMEGDGKQTLKKMLELDPKKRACINELGKHRLVKD